MSNEAARAEAALTAPQLTLGQTLSGIYFEPGQVFESFRARPRFLVAALIATLAFLAFNTLFIQRLGYENIVRAQIESRMPDTDQAQREQIIAAQSGQVGKTIGLASPLIGFALVYAIGGALYLLGTLAMGKSISYKQALAVWSYSSLPPSVLVMTANIVLLLIKAPEDIDLATSGRGLARANPGFLVDGSASPVLATLLGSIDLFAIYGLFLGALGLRKVARLSSGSAWAVVIGIFLIGLLIRVALAAALKTPFA